MSTNLEKTYNPSQVEDRIYKYWLDGGYFHAEVDENKKPYTIVIPPPNITGQLHMGHALDNTLQDILIRTRRMQGYSALWLPGTDHASIATEAKIVEAMKKEGISKEDLGRDKFLERAWEWKKTYGGRIVEQLKKLGSSCDWDRERFTLDEGCNKAVNEVFVRLYEKGLIYRGERIINWCPHCLTSISDAEVEHEEKAGHFWHILYPLTDGSGSLEIATTRPETMLGDTALAVNPNDDRYKHLIGKTVTLPLVNREIPIIADDYVDIEFGTGALKITPAHDPNDFEVGARHNLEVINIFTEDAKINENGGKYQGLDRYDAREQIVNDLKDGGFLKEIKDHTHNVGTCYRCQSVIEPYVSKQWFVKMKPLALPAIDAVKSGETVFIPERFDKIYFHWMENIKDWCISRQLWWGHQIPAYYCDKCGEVIVSADTPEKCPKCGDTHLTRDPDTLDTWFSSALWPFSTLGWPDNTPELNYFYPTSTLVTGYDIIFFWVARMIFSAIEHTGKAPFDTVFIHGIVRDSQGRKMSKSLGNGIDPLEIISLYGADALRFMLASSNSPGNDMRFTDDKVIAARNFANKLYNASRFILMNLGDLNVSSELPENLKIEDKWILSKLNSLTKEVCENIDKFELGIAAFKIYDFIWDVFCDWYIELAKTRFMASEEEKKDSLSVLIYVMNGFLKLLHPFMPFITEEIYQNLPNSSGSIMVSKFPEYDEKFNFTDVENDFELIIKLISAIRVARNEKNVPPSKKAKIIIETDKRELFSNCSNFIKKLAFSDDIEIVDKVDNEISEKSVLVISDSARAFLPLSDLVNKDEELKKLEKELASVENDLRIINSKLNNENFVSKAPQNVIEGEKVKLANALDRKEKILTSIKVLEA